MILDNDALSFIYSALCMATWTSGYGGQPLFLLGDTPTDYQPVGVLVFWHQRLIGRDYGIFQKKSEDFQVISHDIFTKNPWSKDFSIWPFCFKILCSIYHNHKVAIRGRHLLNISYYSWKLVILEQFWPPYYWKTLRLLSYQSLQH